MYRYSANAPTSEWFSQAARNRLDLGQFWHQDLSSDCAGGGWGTK
jgi:hypothetical protein